MPPGLTLACTAKPAHQCVTKASEISTMFIQYGELVLNTIKTNSRATFDVVCEDGAVKGTVTCIDQVFKTYNDFDWENACADTIVPVIFIE